MIRKNMTRLAAAAAFVALFAGVANAAVVLNDNFDSYTTGSLVGQGGWLQTGATATNPIQVVGVGADNAASLITSGQDVYKALSASIPHVDGDAVHTSLSLVVTAAQAAGDYFAHLSDPVATTSTFYQRLHARSSGAGYQLGMAEISGGTITYGTQVLDFNTEYDVDVLWNFVAGADNDTFAVTVNDLPYLTHTWTSATDEPAQITAANFRQGTAANAPTLQVDNYIVEGVAAVPEPASVTLLALGAVALLRRRRRAA
jgi:hypothetical protein